MNPEDPQLETVMDLPGCGDTSFASFVRISKDRYLIANYSSPKDFCENWAWIRG